MIQNHFTLSLQDPKGQVNKYRGDLWHWDSKKPLEKLLKVR